jgi:hypothetical protein
VHAYLAPGLILVGVVAAIRVIPAVIALCRADKKDIPAIVCGLARWLDERHHRHRAGVRHEIRVGERCVRLRQAMQQSHVTRVLSNQAMEALDTPVVPVQRAPFTLTPPNHPYPGALITLVMQ